MIDKTSIKNQILIEYKNINETRVNEIIGHMEERLKELLLNDYDNYNFKCIGTTSDKYLLMDEDKYKLVVIEDGTFRPEIVETYELSTDNPKIDYDNLRLLLNSSKNIKYQLFPFEQGSEIYVEKVNNKYQFLKYNDIVEIELVDNTTQDKLRNVLNKYPKCRNFLNYDFYAVEWFNNMFVCMFYESDCDNILIVVLKDNKIISGFKCVNDGAFQEGDCTLWCYMDKYTDDLIIQNGGDVSSTIVVKYN